MLAKQYLRRNPNAKVRVIGWDLNMTHYGHVELPAQLAAGFDDVVNWMLKQDA